MTSPPRCDRPDNHGPHTFVTHPLSDIDHECPGLDPVPPWPSPVGTPLPASYYADAERTHGQARAREQLRRRRLPAVLAVLIVTVEAQARIEGIPGIQIPFRPQEVRR
jgi:hypothetical protein